MHRPAPQWTRDVTVNSIQSAWRVLMLGYNRVQTALLIAKDSDGMGAAFELSIGVPEHTAALSNLVVFARWHFANACRKGY